MREIKKEPGRPVPSSSERIRRRKRRTRHFCEKQGLSQGQKKPQAATQGLRKDEIQVSDKMPQTQLIVKGGLSCAFPLE
jgi:hypothetical protein